MRVPALLREGGKVSGRASMSLRYENDRIVLYELHSVPNEKSTKPPICTLQTPKDNIWKYGITNREAKPAKRRTSPKDVAA